MEGFGGAPGSIAVYSAPVAGGPPTLVRQGITERTDVFNLFGGEANVTASVEEFGQAPLVWTMPAPRTASVGTPTIRRHENFGAVITFSHRASNVVVTDVAVPPAGSNGGVATSPRVVAGSPVPHPAVAVITNGYEGVCPTRVACTEWLHFQKPSTLTTVVGFDATYFYLGDRLGLRRCALAEIDTLRTCTFTDLAAEPVDYPFYVVPNTSGDATAVWYRSGDRVRRLTLP